MYILTLLRHGESVWNLENKFTGWTDVDLSKNGLKEAKDAGSLLKERGFSFDLVYTSYLKRAKKTMDICLDEMSLSGINKVYDWRLNERHYGALQGLNKTQTARKYGDKQVFIWRRSYDIPPPPLDKDDERHASLDPKYKEVKSIPNSESLKDTCERLTPLLEKDIFKNIKKGGKILIVAHGNSLRAIVKYVNNMSEKEIINLNIPTGKPLIFELNENLSPAKYYYLEN